MLCKDVNLFCNNSFAKIIFLSKFFVLDFFSKSFLRLWLNALSIFLFLGLLQMFPFLYDFSKNFIACLIFSHKDILL